MSDAVHEFTLDALEWQPYVKPVDLQTATPEQLDALKVTPSNTKVSAYVLVLAQETEMLAERSPLFNDIMYSDGGLSRGGRELGALAASFVNHCIYCAQVHANRFIQLEKGRKWWRKSTRTASKPILANTIRRCSILASI
jgi:uncharacterized peroxidase-related enzyme